MPSNVVQQRLFPYDGTQDSTKNPILISPKDIVYSNNIVYTTYSTKKKRPGLRYAFDIIKKTGDIVLAAHDFWRLGKQYVVIWDGKRIKAIDPTLDTIDDISGDFELPTDESVTFVPYQGVLIIFFGGNNTIPKYWDQTGSIQNLSATISLASFGRVWFNRLIVPDPTVQGRLLLSQTGSPTAFTGGDSTTIDLDPNDGDPDGITAIFPPFFGSLYVAKRLSLYKITPVQIDATTIVFSRSKISDGIGCISHNGVCAAENQIFFPSDWGWHQFESTDKISEVDTSLLSREIQPIWREDTNFNSAKYIQSIYDRQLNSILCIFPSGSFTFPTDLWGFSLVAKKWYRWSDYNQTAFCRYIDAENKKLYTMVGSNKGELGLIDPDVKNDYGKKISCFIQSGIIAPAGEPDDEFSFEQIAPIYVPQVTGSFSITMKIDGVTTFTQEFDMEDTSLGDELGIDFITGQSILGGLPNVAMEKTRINGQGMLYQLIIEHVQNDAEEDVDFELLGILFDMDRINKKTGKRVA